MRYLLERARLRLAPRLLLAEAVLYLLAARFALSIFSFQQLTRFFTSPARQPELVGAERARVRNEVGRVVFKVRRTSLLRTTCMHRAIAAQAMLRRRGVSTTLCYGARTLPEEGLTTHVWLQDGTQGVVGHYSAKSYYILERFPNAEANSDSFGGAL